MKKKTTIATILAIIVVNTVAFADDEATEATEATTAKQDLNDEMSQLQKFEDVKFWDSVNDADAPTAYAAAQAIGAKIYADLKVIYPHSSGKLVASFPLWAAYDKTWTKINAAIKLSAQHDCLENRDSKYNTYEGLQFYINDATAARRGIAHEKANPAGLVDIVYLHEQGERLQLDNERIAEIKKTCSQK